MAVLKDERLLFLSFDRAGVLQKTRAPRALRALGRVRTVVSDTDGTLLVTTEGIPGPVSEHLTSFVSAAASLLQPNVRISSRC